MAKLFKRREPERVIPPEPQVVETATEPGLDDALSESDFDDTAGSVDSLAGLASPPSSVPPSKLSPGSIAARFTPATPITTEEVDGLAMFEIADSLAPEMPKDLADTGIEFDVLAGLILKYAASV